MTSPSSSFFPRLPRPTDPPATPELALGVPGFSYADLHRPARLADLHATFWAWFRAEAPEAASTFTAYADAVGSGARVKPEDASTAVLVAAPYVSRFVGRLFAVEEPLEALRASAEERGALWRFKAAFAKKRVLKESAGKAWSGTPAEATAVARVAIACAPAEAAAADRGDEELRIASAVVALVDLDETARKSAKAGGAVWTPALAARAAELREALLREPTCAEIAATAVAVDGPSPSPAEDGRVAAFALDALEAWLAHRRHDHHDPAHAWPSLHAPRNLDFSKLVEVVRPDPARPELFVGPAEHRRPRDGFALTDRRMGARAVESEIDYCLYCHERDKDSCSKGLRDNKSNEVKKNPIGVLLEGCPLEERISEMHALRRDGDALGALAVVCIDNPMCAGTGHRICNDCMKACVFQKQEPVNIPQAETRVLTEILELPYGLEIYGFLTRWNPLNVRRPYSLPYNGKNVLVVGLGPAGYTLAHHLTREGFSVTAVDGLKLEPLPEALVGTAASPPTPVRELGAICQELDERLVVGFGGVSEYGITVRWDKNFLTVLYVTLARNRLLQLHGGVRFGGTLDLDDAWALGFDHVALAAGAGRPTFIDMKNNLARGIRKASDFLMALQLTGAYKKSTIANLQVKLPALVIGGGLTAIDTATELIAYYPVQVAKTLARTDTLRAELGEQAFRAMFDEEEWATLSEHLAHGRELQEERARAAAEGRAPDLAGLVERWGGVSLVYRKAVQDSPAYRLNHEEVHESLREGVRYVENLSPVEAVLDTFGHVKAVSFKRPDGGLVELPARTVCVAAGTSPNVTYEREYTGTFELDARGQYYQVHSAKRVDGGVVLEKARPREGFFTSYAKDGRVVSVYGDNHPHYAGSVVKAMASAKDGYRHVAALFPDLATLDPAEQPARDLALAKRFAHLDAELGAHVVEVNRLTKTIVEVVVRAPMAARKFQPGQFYRLQNFEALAPLAEDTRLAMEGLALTGAWTDPERGLLGTIVLEMGGSSRLCASLKPGEPVVLMGPTGQPTDIARDETVLLLGGGLGNAVLFSIARAFKALGATVLYFAGYKDGDDLFKQADIEAHTDQVVWCTDKGVEITPRRPQDAHFRGNIVQAMLAFGKGELRAPVAKLSSVHRILAIGSDRMMDAVREARHGVLLPLLNPKHLAIGSINSPMQCMMKEICAQCLQKHRDPVTGREHVVFSCFNQDQELDHVDFAHLRERLRANSVQEKIVSSWLEHVLRKHPELR
ncbi:MAG: FAD-dependent oxidoreductase [Myxococcales bacterium]|nr:FAD-dependent oxidoreductase [Myxococcales bacterium]